MYYVHIIYQAFPMTTPVRRRLALVSSADLITEVTGCEEFASLDQIDYRAKYVKFSQVFASIHVSFQSCTRSN